MKRRLGYKGYVIEARADELRDRSASRITFGVCGSGAEGTEKRRID
jgi:hypothetical protein